MIQSSQLQWKPLMDLMHQQRKYTLDKLKRKKKKEGRRRLIEKKQKK